MVNSVSELAGMDVAQLKVLIRKAADELGGFCMSTIKMPTIPFKKMCRAKCYGQRLRARATHPHPPPRLSRASSEPVARARGHAARSAATPGSGRPRSSRVWSTTGTVAQRSHLPSPRERYRFGGCFSEPRGSEAPGGRATRE